MGPQAQRRSLPPKFSDRPKNQKIKKNKIDRKSKQLKFPESPSVQWPPKIPKNQFFDKSERSEICKIVKNRRTSPVLTWLGGWDTDTHKHSAVASRQNFQTTKKTKSAKNKKNEISRIPEFPMTPQNTPKSNFWQKSEIFKIVKNRGTSPVLTWLGGWDTTPTST